jgi:hypothetical protein
MNVFVTNKILLDFIKINANDEVVIKPNLVKECSELDINEWESVITSSKLIFKVTQHVCKELNGTGKITICDAPQTDSDFAKIAGRLGLFDMANELTAKYKTPVEILDLRNEQWLNEAGVITQRAKLAGDPKGVIKFNLGQSSLFYGHKGEGKYYGADYDYDSLNQHHNGENHEYLLCASPIMANVFINLPKLKTHKKAGITSNLKNLVGINADKNFLPHHTFGSPFQRGDEFPDSSWFRKFETISSQIVKKAIYPIPFIGPAFTRFLRNKGMSLFGDSSNTIRSGNWSGNDTTWRMALDLNRCMFYGNPDGTLRDEHSKRYYSVIDADICMEGNGPMQGTPKRCGIYIAGTDPVAVDAVAATMMGFDWHKIPMICEAFKLSILPVASCKPEEIMIESDTTEWNGTLENLINQKHFDFEPPFGWKNHIELNR